MCESSTVSRTYSSTTTSSSYLSQEDSHFVVIQAVFGLDARSPLPPDGYIARGDPRKLRSLAGASGCFCSSHGQVQLQWRWRRRRRPGGGRRSHQNRFCNSSMENVRLHYPSSSNGNQIRRRILIHRSGSLLRKEEKATPTRLAQGRARQGSIELFES